MQSCVFVDSGRIENGTLIGNGTKSNGSNKMLFFSDNIFVKKEVGKLIQPILYGLTSKVIVLSILQDDLSVEVIIASR